MKDRFFMQLKDLQIQLSDEQRIQFHRYYELLIEWNKVMNLTGITEYSDVYEKHFVDSISVVHILDLNSFYKVIDVGTGAGFPGLPLKIVFPHLKIVLLDALKKRVNFLNEVVQKLGLDDVEILHGRAEEYARKLEYREQFDLCVSRAVADLSVLSEYCLPFVKEGGYFISYKSGNIDDEVRQAETAVNVLGGNIERIVKFQLPESEIKRSFVKIDKVKFTDHKYPRKAGTPERKPIHKI